MTENHESITTEVTETVMSRVDITEVEGDPEVIRWEPGPNKRFIVKFTSKEVIVEGAHDKDDAEFIARLRLCRELLFQIAENLFNVGLDKVAMQIQEEARVIDDIQGSDLQGVMIKASPEKPELKDNGNKGTD